MECALWNLLHPNMGVDVIGFDVFSNLWVYDICHVLPLLNYRTSIASFGTFPDCSFYNPNRDFVMTWCGTTAGVCPLDVNFIPDDRQCYEGLTIVDATSAVFCTPIPWVKFDAIAYSWQKGMGGEAAHGILAISPRAVQRLETMEPPWPIPRLFRLRQQKNTIQQSKRDQRPCQENDYLSINRGIFEGKTINTPSVFAIIEAHQCLKWMEKIIDDGGVQALYQRTLDNANRVTGWVEEHSCALQWLCPNPLLRSPAVACIQVVAWINQPNELQLYQRLKHLMATYAHVYDCINHALAPLSIRLWCGPTQELSEIDKALPWLWWGIKEVSQEVIKS